VSAERLVDNPSRGAAGAPVTIVEYGDFGCPSCKAWHQAGVIDQILATYGDRVRFIWRDLPVITAQSPKAAEAAQCAYDQRRFWDYHDLLFERAPRLGTRDLKSYAAELGLDQASFEECLDTGTHRETVNLDRVEAQRKGFRGTPSFTVNEQPLIGPNPNFMIQMIERELAGP
jgi:protein-disulfide isomerase